MIGLNQRDNDSYAAGTVGSRDLAYPGSSQCANTSFAGVLLSHLRECGYGLRFDGIDNPEDLLVQSIKENFQIKSVSEFAALFSFDEATAKVMFPYRGNPVSVNALYCAYRVTARQFGFDLMDLQSETHYVDGRERLIEARPRTLQEFESIWFRVRQSLSECDRVVAMGSFLPSGHFVNAHPRANGIDVIDPWGMPSMTGQRYVAWNPMGQQTGTPYTLTLEQAFKKDLACRISILRPVG